MTILKMPPRNQRETRVGKGGIDQHRVVHLVIGSHGVNVVRQRNIGESRAMNRYARGGSHDVVPLFIPGKIPVGFPESIVAVVNLESGLM